MRRVIQQSWVRSTTAGIDPRQGEAPSAGEGSELEKLRQSNRELCRAARGSLDKIGRMLHGAEAMLILTDEKGLVIEAIGDPKTLAAGRDINLHVGALWNEHAVGTNGIGTALWAGEPMFVHGSEHYVESLKEWSCAAAPIRNPVDQSVIGAVDLSGLTKIFRHHNTAFAAAAAGEIQAALAQALNEERIRLLEALIEQGPATGHEDGVLILDRAGRVVHRSGFERLILADGTEMDTRIGQRLIHLTGAPTADAVASALPEGFGYREVSGLKIDGELRGVALVLANRRSGRRVAAPAVAAAGPKPAPAHGIIAESPGMLEAIDLARRVARVNAPVLVQGETGTGKELFARLIHTEYSGGRDKPFVAINCGAIARELFGGELFGHVHGAFTGAVREGKAGKLEQANGGVFCLDEIGEMPLEIQPYLLRVLEERTIYRIGDSRARPFDARLVALTNRDLRAEADVGPVPPRPLLPDRRGHRARAAAARTRRGRAAAARSFQPRDRGGVRAGAAALSGRALRPVPALSLAGQRARAAQPRAAAASGVASSRHRAERPAARDHHRAPGRRARAGRRTGDPAARRGEGRGHEGDRRARRQPHPGRGGARHHPADALSQAQALQHRTGVPVNGTAARRRDLGPGRRP